MSIFLTLSLIVYSWWWEDSSRVSSGYMRITKSLLHLNEYICIKKFKFFNLKTIFNQVGFPSLFLWSPWYGPRMPLGGIYVSGLVTSCSLIELYCSPFPLLPSLGVLVSLMCWMIEFSLVLWVHTLALWRLPLRGYNSPADRRVSPLLL